MSALSDETPLLFACAGDELVAIITSPKYPGPTGVLIVVGGPQYRIGSHRQFIHLARHLAQNGVTCMRFDYRGMGDAGGKLRGFEAVNEDIRAAVDALLTQCPDIRRVVLWGLCDGASAACFYAPQDPRVAGVVLVNPWVRTEAGQAKTYLRHYYVQRFFAPALWRKLFSRQLTISAAIGSFWHEIRRALHTETASAAPRNDAHAELPFPERMAVNLARFKGRILVVLSGNDYTAREFSASASTSNMWLQALRNAETRRLEAADHTFSTRAWKDELAVATAQWVIAEHAPSALKK